MKAGRRPRPASLLRLVVLAALVAQLGGGTVARAALMAASADGMSGPERLGAVASSAAHAVLMRDGAHGRPHLVVSIAVCLVATATLPAAAACLGAADL